jgi:hypothetical protein
VVIKNEEEANEFLKILNKIHPPIEFTMESAVNGTLSFLGMSLTKQGSKITTSVYRKPTNKGLFLHYKSHVDNRYKKSLLITMLHRALNLSSTNDQFNEECQKIKSMFQKLEYPLALIDATVSNFVKKSRDQSQTISTEADVINNKTIRIVLPFIDQKPANVLRQQIIQLNQKLNSDIQPVFTSRKLEDTLKQREPKPPMVSQQRVVYQYKCGSCDASYVGYTIRHLHQRIDEHRYTAIGTHRLQHHGLTTAAPATSFNILRKCRTKTECLIYEMFFIKELSPSLNTQSDSVRAKLFT